MASRRGAYLYLYTYTYTLYTHYYYTHIYTYIHKYIHLYIQYRSIHQYVNTSIHQYINTSSESNTSIESNNERFDNCEEMASRGAVKTFMAWATNKEHGMLTTHFWGPVANWGLVGSAVYDASFQGPEVRAFLTSADRRSFFFISFKVAHTNTHTHR